MSAAQHVAIVTLPGFNEIDSFVAARMIDSTSGLEVTLVGPNASSTSMAGIEVATPGRLIDLHTFPGVIVGSGRQTFEHVENSAMMAAFTLGRTEGQLVGSQCSGAAILHRLGLLGGVTVCTDVRTAPRLRALGVEVANEPFRAAGSLATSGGCLSSAYLSFWMIARLTSLDAAIRALESVAPIGEAADYLERATRLIQAAPAA